jgi:hypothetical protein
MGPNLRRYLKRRERGFASGFLQHGWGVDANDIEILSSVQQDLVWQPVVMG